MNTIKYFVVEDTDAAGLAPCAEALVFDITLYVNLCFPFTYCTGTGRFILSTVIETRTHLSFCIDMCITYNLVIKIGLYRGLSISCYGYEVVLSLSLSLKLPALHSECEDSLPFLIKMNIQVVLPFLFGLITTKRHCDYMST